MRYAYIILLVTLGIFGNRPGIASEDYFSTLPNKLKHRIVTNELDWESALRLGCVSKPWLATIAPVIKKIDGLLAPLEDIFKKLPPMSRVMKVKLMLSPTVFEKSEWGLRKKGLMHLARKGHGPSLLRISKMVWSTLGKSPEQVLEKYKGDVAALFQRRTDYQPSVQAKILELYVISLGQEAWKKLLDDWAHPASKVSAGDRHIGSSTSSRYVAKYFS